MGGARLYLSGCETVFETKEKKGRDTFMDKIDAMLITLLQENARAPLKLLASKVFLSAPAVSSRIDKLENSGIQYGNRPPEAGISHHRFYQPGAFR